MKAPLLLAPALLFASCASTGDCSSCGSDAARAPESLVQLYDMLAPDGMMELELQRDGTYLELEADVPVDTLPADFVATCRASYPDARITGAEREVQGDVWTWEIKFTSGGRSMEMVLDADGNLLETERELTLDEAPDAVIAASEAAIPSSTFISVERITSSDDETFHVKRQRGTARYKIVLSGEGDVLRKVREAVAEIEIPLD